MCFASVPVKLGAISDHGCSSPNACTSLVQTLLVSVRHRGIFPVLQASYCIRMICDNDVQLLKHFNMAVPSLCTLQSQLCIQAPDSSHAR